MNQSENINELATALAKAQSEIQGAKKESANPYFKSKYADLSSVWEACREPLTKNGLSVMQTTAEKEGKQYLYTTLAHSSGQWIRSELQILVSKNDIQALGSAITYCRRYSLAMIAGVCPEDDDGNAASSNSKSAAALVNNESKISSDQSMEIKKLLAKCPQNFVNSLLGSLRNPPISANSIDDIPLSQHDRVTNYIKDMIKSQESKTNE